MRSETHGETASADTAAWRQAALAGRFRIIKEEEARMLLTALDHTATVIDERIEGATHGEMQRFLTWAEAARKNDGLLDALIRGHVFVRMVGREPQWELTKDGAAAVRALGEEMGLP
jgi:hypothetical protein